ncbi:response regulator transcription factor [Aurantimonas sp. HBX-1]|uniref:response regulator n=1 Tax=Aurantimonas sp. HBX-1 TaxID=2906072 RepID=UPI001F1853F4|nr:response regulator transcription factor [Aurantimonas sp. HBX-1]UIJ70479.1 response regulator transcription factor [Aurantimonas sp. HBX-1]
MPEHDNTALIADDDEFFRMALSSILSGRLGLSEVIETGSFDEAVEQLEQKPGITVALFDLSMPGMGNPANLRVIRELFPDIRVIIVSSSRRREDILAALEAGVHGYVPKGLGVDDLTQALKSVLGGSIYVPPSLADVSGLVSQRPAMAVPDEVPAPQPERLPPLTPRQRDVLELLVKGWSNKEVARMLDLGEGTVKIHLAALFRNLGVRNRAAAAVLGARLLAAEKDREADVKGATGSP